MENGVGLRKGRGDTRQRGRLLCSLVTKISNCLSNLIEQRLIMRVTTEDNTLNGGMKQLSNRSKHGISSALLPLHTSIGERLVMNIDLLIIKH